MKLRKIITGAGAFIAASMVIFAFNAFAKDSAHLWELEVTTATGDTDLNTVNNWTCVPDAEWSKPPVVLTGAQCPAQTFTRTGDVLSWSVSCDGTQGTGEWKFARGDRAVEGQSTVTSNGVTSVIIVNGKKAETCTP